MKKLSTLAPLALLLLVVAGVDGCDSKPLGGVDGCTYNGKSYPTGKSFPASDGCNTCSCQSGQPLCTLLACTDGGSGICFDSNGNQVTCTTLDAGATDAHPIDAGGGDAGATDAGLTCFDANGKAIPCMSDAGAGCTYNGKTYKVGSSFTCTDGCNTCTCTSMGIASTTKACLDGSVDGSPTCFDASGNIVRCATDGGLDCMYDGKPYPAGASFSTSDGCNTCNCAAGGMVACTHRTCPDGGADAPSTCFDADGKITPCTSDGGPAGVCMPGVDQACNDDPALSTLLGKCRPDLTCDCGANTLNPATGRCVPAGMMPGCSYGGTTYAVGSKFMCSVDAGCNDGICFCATPGMTVPLCGGDAPPVCGFDAVYVYGQTGGLVAYSDQVTLTPPASYVLVRTAGRGASSLSGSCGPALPACTAGPIDVSDIMRDIADPTVQLLLSLSAMQPTLLGIDQRPVDGTVFSFKKGDTAGFLVGAPCNGGTNCTEIPGSVRTLMDDLQKLDALQRQDPSCAAFMKTM